MATCTRNTYWGIAYVDADISKDDSKSTYNDDCGHVITITKGVPPANGYKRYNHTLHLGLYFVCIRRSKSIQAGLGNLKDGIYRKVTVIYLNYDEHNLVPLLIGISGDRESYKYFFQEHYFYHNQWQRLGVSSENEIPPKLGEISAQLKELVVLRLTKTQGAYYANGESGSAPQTNETTKINVTEVSTEDAIYKRYNHFPSGIDRMRLISTKSANNTNIPFDSSSIYLISYDFANVYFWAGDSDYERPLLLELASEQKTYYKFERSSWVSCSLSGSNLNNELNRENCDRNRAHQIDISKNTASYICLTQGCNVKITVSHSSIPTHNYSQCIHSFYSRIATKFSVSRFKYSETDQFGFPSVKDVNSITVFWYPLRDGKPLLIHYQVYNNQKWFMKTKVDNTWKEVSEDTIKPNGAGDHDGIKKLLIEASSPEVTIQLEKVPSSSGSYQSDNETINIERKDATGASGYSQITHKITRKAFVVKDIQHRGQSQTLKDTATFPTDLLDSLSVFYAKSDSKVSKPLLLELKLQDVAEYTYYEKTEKVNEWTLYSRTESTQQLNGDLLKQKLDDLNGIHHPKTPTPEQSTDAKSPKTPPSESGELEESKPKSHDSTPEKYPSSPVGPAVGGTIGALVLVAVVGVMAKRHWPTTEIKYILFHNVRSV
ncbi:hypothetical protein BEWA_054130 [Theileria equi strain WA]|uniref:Uncharacterized protein n=1 Tax=Theileria equi strain WA TaxID=1537102 RepID=L1LD49_THEEQ|nr:hypothetical protein BEWA_054130 [Theileria equi strain WA]EKX73357.1 hypothetical protein BEWA_054130 [Theileria equi strain WA]|eukprot:XP_004832809.1 hypothetical protein BEWA_054130 [Theileria equi strain WA]